MSGCVIKLLVCNRIVNHDQANRTSALSQSRLSNLCDIIRRASSNIEDDVTNRHRENRQRAENKAPTGNSDNASIGSGPSTIQADGSAPFGIGCVLSRAAFGIPLLSEISTGARLVYIPSTVEIVIPIGVEIVAFYKDIKSLAVCIELCG
jgi:hypothetical protein